MTELSGTSDDRLRAFKTQRSSVRTLRDAVAGKAFERMGLERLSTSGGLVISRIFVPEAADSVLEEAGRLPVRVFDLDLYHVRDWTGVASLVLSQYDYTADPEAEVGHSVRSTADEALELYFSGRRIPDLAGEFAGDLTEDAENGLTAYRGDLTTLDRDLDQFTVRVDLARTFYMPPLDVVGWAVQRHLDSLAQTD
jgi:hypothetical protein